MLDSFLVGPAFDRGPQPRAPRPCWPAHCPEAGTGALYGDLLGIARAVTSGSIWVLCERPLGRDRALIGSGSSSWPAGGVAAAGWSLHPSRACHS